MEDFIISFRKTVTNYHRSMQYGAWKPGEEEKYSWVTIKTKSSLCYFHATEPQCAPTFFQDNYFKKKSEADELARRLNELRKTNRL